MKKRPIVLCIMDGYGLTDRVDGNAVKLANTPNLDDLMAMYPTTTIKACVTLLVYLKDRWVTQKLVI